jgi:PAS domain-containing protein
MLGDDVLLAPSLLAALPADSARISLQDWLALIHPADREELRSRLHALQLHGEALSLSVRLHRSESGQTPQWYRVQGQVAGSGEQRRLVGFMLDISDIRNQQQRAEAAHARLDNLIASSPAVIYVQRYVEGALRPDFFSASLQPLLGWTPDEGIGTDWVQLIHPEDRDLYFARTRQLLREGSVRGRSFARRARRIPLAAR